MRQAIETSYRGPTDAHGSRVLARAQAGRITIGWDDALSVDANHEAAARALCKKLGWSGRLYAGGLASGRGNVFVFAEFPGLEVRS